MRYDRLLKNTRRDVSYSWFYPERYGEARYQQNNSVIDGSVSCMEKGLYNTTIASVKNGNFLSEEQTDFIFAVIGEELGFIGCAVLIPTNCFY